MSALHLIQGVIFLQYLHLCRGELCSGDLCTKDWYGPQAHSAYLVRDDIYKDNPHRCRETVPLSRCEMAGFNTDDHLDKYDGTCLLPDAGCSTMKQNCNDTLTCNDLLQLHDMLMQVQNFLQQSFL